MIFFTQAIYGVLYAVTGSTRAVVDLVPGQPRRRSATSIFRQPLRYDTPWPVSLLVLVGADRASRLSVLERRVRGVEVVA